MENKIKELELAIENEEGHIERMQKRYDDDNFYGKGSEYLCDITMKTIRLDEKKEKLKELKGE